MNFEEYCRKKKIDPLLFKEKEPARFEEFAQIFSQVHPESFTQQKKFLINEIRRKYQLKEEPVQDSETAGKPASTPKPAIKIGPKIK
jgi:hypothetical protein